MKLASCHSTRKHKGRDLCGSCYDKWLKSVNPVYKSNQISNTTKWKNNNPDKYKILVQKRLAREKLDPSYKERKANKSLMRMYGISTLDRDFMLHNQNNSCALCFRQQGKFRLHIDHDHITKRVRGLLCHQCNWYLGTIEADLSILERIREYLK